MQRAGMQEYRDLRNDSGSEGRHRGGPRASLGQNGSLRPPHGGQAAGLLFRCLRTGGGCCRHAQSGRAQAHRDGRGTQCRPGCRCTGCRRGRRDEEHQGRTGDQALLGGSVGEYLVTFRAHLIQMLKPVEWSNTLEQMNHFAVANVDGLHKEINNALKAFVIQNGVPFLKESNKPLDPSSYKTLELRYFVPMHMIQYIDWEIKPLSQSSSFEAGDGKELVH